MHLDDFLCGRIISRLEWELTHLEVSEELEIAQSVIYKLWQRFQDAGQTGLYACRPVGCVPLTVTHCRLWLTWSREHALWTPQLWTYVMFSDESRFSLLYVRLSYGERQRDIILEQLVRLFRGTMGTEFVFMDDNTRPHHANIVNECLQSEDITRIDWPAFSPDLNPLYSDLCTRDFGCVLGVQQTKQLPHVAKFDLVWQLGV
ncbi:transposable element Tcb1 transposase [Trichonephila clavipes]|uniref:Transposable element Tcb1 transposase n=1 Tax=Trichonephila clavipes TaxID=2585209 RepID=A0A8X6W040_TRICX|nr:transposable element Tcb1 transposase [Trichonephila clavipes]